MTSVCDLCGSDDCVPVISVIKWDGKDVESDTGTHTCKEHCLEATGMSYEDYIKKYKYRLAGLGCHV